MRIKLNTINDVNSFVNTSTKYYDGKSILGIFSLNLTQPIEISINTDNVNTERDFYNFIKKWEVNDED